MMGSSSISPIVLRSSDMAFLHQGPCPKDDADQSAALASCLVFDRATQLSDYSLRHPKTEPASFGERKRPILRAGKDRFRMRRQAWPVVADLQAQTVVFVMDAYADARAFRRHTHRIQRDVKEDLPYQAGR